MTQELSDNIKRLRRISEIEWFAVDRDDSIQAINQLVELVAEMFVAHKLGQAVKNYIAFGRDDEALNAHKEIVAILTKADALLTKLGDV